MKMKSSPRYGSARPIALFTASAILVPTLIAGCGGGAQQSATPTAIDRSNSAPPPAMGTTAARRPGMTGKQKMVALAGAAALFYLYKKYQSRPMASGVQYYQSKANGRIYYRDKRNPQQAIYVTPPQQPVMVPQNEAAQYQGYAGYNNQAQGQNFGGYGYNQNGTYQGQAGSVPAPVM
ncbi:MAG TPA: hypothetical protein VM821_00395 [Abditibacteriaceae bacterium]|jgi:hypothetical protein|nr:hypothetical protein [Abditibacteriaceae bacterium]